MADVAHRAQQLDGFEHVVEVVRGLAHAHEDDLLDRAARARQGHLRDDLGAADLAQQAVLARHAEHAAHRATHLRGHAQAIARQQHALTCLAVLQAHEQALGAVRAGVGRAQRRQAHDFAHERIEPLAHGLGQEVFGAALAAALRQGLGPQAQHALLVDGLGAERAQALADVFDAHGEKGR